MDILSAIEKYINFCEMFARMYMYFKGLFLFYRLISPVAKKRLKSATALCIFVYTSFLTINMSSQEILL